MKVEVAVFEYKEMDLIEALATHIIAWDYEIITGAWAEQYYPAEEDDHFLEITQETINTYDGGCEYRRLCWLECSDLVEQLKYLHGNSAKRLVLEYLQENIDRAIDIEKTGGFW